MNDDTHHHRREGKCLIDIIVQTVDHLGIVAGIVDELGVVETINEYLGQDPHEQIIKCQGGRGVATVE